MQSLIPTQYNSGGLTVMKLFILALLHVIGVSLIAAQQNNLANRRCAPVDNSIDCRVALPPFECRTDRQCDRGQTCCPTFCGGRQCRRPLSPSCPAVNRGAVCILSLPNFECQSDADCTSGVNCCPTDCGGTTCLNPQCPIVDPAIVCVQAGPIECDSNADCDSGENCCPTECGGRSCTGGSRPPPNNGCPAVRFPLPQICQRVRLRFVCDPDGDSSECSAGETCCRTRARCNTGDCITIPDDRDPRCRIRVPRVLPDRCAFTTVLAECRRNSDCGANRICCPSSECGGGQCVRVPGPRPTRPTRPRRCPRVPRFQNSPFFCRTRRPVRECRRNSDCGRRRRCCRTACGGRVCR